MKKLIVITIALAALLAASGASAATYIIRIGVDDDESGFVYEYNNITEQDCGSYCLRWKTNSLPYEVYGVHARIYKDNSAEYYWCDWDALHPDTGENNPDQTATVPTLSGDRVYEMSHYWDNGPVEYWFSDFADFQYKYNSSSPVRTRRFQVYPIIE